MKPLDGLRQLPTEFEPPRGVRERARQRLLASLALPLAPLTASEVVPRPAASSLLAQHAGVKLAFLTLGSGIIGATLAFGAPRLVNRLHGTTDQQAAMRAPAVSTPALVQTTVSPNGTSADAAEVQRLPLAESAPRRVPRTQPSSVSHASKSVTSLAAERALLDSAREQLSSGQALRAFELTETHLSRFPTGKLAEEREVLAVAALVRSGARERASRRAERFKQSYPNSFLTKAIEASLGESP